MMVDRPEFDTVTEDDENDDDPESLLPPVPPPGYQEIIDGRLIFISMDDLVTDIDNIFTEMEVISNQMEFD